MILKFDGKTIERSSDLPRIVGSTKPGHAGRPMTVWRKGSSRDLKITVGEMAPDRPRRRRRGEAPKGGGEVPMRSAS